jgi:hypothetical protein
VAASGRAVVGQVRLIEQGGDRLSQIGVADNLGQQAGERPGTKLTAVSGEATQITRNLGDAKGEPDRESSYVPCDGCGG